jgi:peptide chain release factor subunit 1
MGRPGLDLPPELFSLTEIDLGALSEATDDEDIFLSVYLPAGKDKSQMLSQRRRAIEKALPRDLAQAFDRTWAMIEPAMASAPVKGERGRLVFASEPLGFFSAFRLPVELQPLVVLGRSPFLLPLARLREDYEDYLLLLLDSKEARIFLVRSDLLEEIERARIDLMNKHKKGGWSQMRFSRLRQGAIHSFLSQVVEDLSHQDLASARGLVLAGPGEAKRQLLEMLPASLKGKVLGILDLPMGAQPKEMVRRGDELAREEEMNRAKLLAARLREAALKGGPAAFGPPEVRMALEEGRVDYLLVSGGFNLPGMICNSCHHPSSDGKACPACGGELAALRLEELYILARRTGARVVLVEDDDFLEKIGYVGAILRYR